MTLTQQEKNVRIAAACGKGDLFVIVKRGLYYRPDAHGYTANIAEAWILPEVEARKREYLRGDANERVTIEPAPVTDYFASLDACHQAEWKLDSTKHREFRAQLSAVTEDHSSTMSIRLEQWERNYVSASAEQRAEAFGLTLGLWEVGE